jgi:hypothetical protein
VIPAIRLELRRMRALVVWTAVVAIAYGGIVAAIYPTFRDNNQMIEDYMALFPEEILAAFGMVGSLADPGVFMNTYITSMLWPIVAAVVGIALATRPVAGDLERGFLELPLSTRLSRVRYLGIAILGQAGAIAVLALATPGGSCSPASTPLRSASRSRPAPRSSPSSAWTAGGPPGSPPGSSSRCIWPTRWPRRGSTWVRSSS